MSDAKTINLDKAFSSFSAHWTPHVAGEVGDTYIKLAKLSGAFDWHYHEDEDELFLVHKGRLTMKFRDRDEVIEQGEFIIVPRGVEHCPVSLSDECEVVLIEPKSTLNTGVTETDRTISDLPAIRLWEEQS